MTGGFDNGFKELKSVEYYDYYDNRWTYLPDMITKRSSHATVSMGNKMFAIGGSKTLNCETFNNYSRKFTSVKPISKLSYIHFHSVKAVCVGKHITVIHIFLGKKETKMYVYDIDKQLWSNVDYKDSLLGSNCVKYYKQ